MIGSATWNGRRGPVILGPTEHRVARWLADRTRHGRITVRMVDLAADALVTRKEAYRITARLRVLGLFGIENDRGGTKGGRRFWRTAIRHDGQELDDGRHREAWARVVAWARARGEQARARLAALRPHTPVRTRWAASQATAPEVEIPPSPSGAVMLDRLIAGGLSPRLITEFTRARRGHR